MKATGVIRRIDDLGRIVIPKEIRKTLRIKEGESLEIFVDNNEQVILKKHSMVKKLSDLAQELTDSIHTFSKNNVLITDNDNILAISGNLKKQYLNLPISEELENKINRREEMLERHSKLIHIIEDEGIEATFAVSPIIVNGDTVGLVMILSNKEIVTEDDFKLAQIAAKFLTTHLE